VRVVKFVIMIMPFYFGYCMVGILVFYTEEDLFGSLWQTSRTLFALVNGDSILLVYQTLCQTSDYGYCAFAQVYLYSFCIIFIVVVLNVFIFIIETGYEKAQRGTGNHDEKAMMLDHDRVCRVLDAADARGGIHMAGVPMEGVTNSIHDDFLEATGIAPHSHDDDPHDGMTSPELDARLHRIVLSALDTHTRSFKTAVGGEHCREATSFQDPIVANLQAEIDRLLADAKRASEQNEVIRQSMEEEFRDEMETVLAENKTLQETVTNLRRQTLHAHAATDRTYE